MGGDFPVSIEIFWPSLNFQKVLFFQVLEMYCFIDGSLDSSGWPEGGDWLGAEPNRGSRGSLKSPNNSTCSRAPVSPVPGSTPLRHLFTDWDEYQDTSGRKFYYNLKTGEKSFKPPRRIRGSSEGYSAPTSPDPFTENGDSGIY